MSSVWQMRFDTERERRKKKHGCGQNFKFPLTLLSYEASDSQDAAAVEI